MSRGRETTVAGLHADDSGHYRDEWQYHLSGRTGDAPDPCASRSRKGVCSAQPRCCNHAGRRWYVQSLRVSQEPEADSGMGPPLSVWHFASSGGAIQLPANVTMRKVSSLPTDGGVPVHERVGWRISI
jgi:hypothetical protein